MDPKQTVREFCAAWEAMDQERILAAFTDDAVYHNMPVAPAPGNEAIESTLAFSPGPRRAAARSRSGDRRRRRYVVMTERIDRSVGGKSIALRGHGHLRAADGKIEAWRDYFDMASWTKQTT